MLPHFQLRLNRGCYLLGKAYPARDFFVEDYAIFTRPKIEVQTLAQVDDFDEGLYRDLSGHWHFTSSAEAEAHRIHDLLGGE